MAVKQDPHPTGWMFTSNSEPTPEKSIFEQHPYLLEPFDHFKDLKPMVYKPEPTIYSGNPAEFQQPWPEEKREQLVRAMDSVFDDETHNEPPAVKAAIKLWKEQNPNKTIKEQRTKLSRGDITELPWLGLVADNELPREPKLGFGSEFPADAAKGDSFVRVDRLPSVLYKYNGRTWLEIDKSLSDQYSHNAEYIDHLVGLINAGKYDTELLTDAEIEQIQQRFQNKQS